MVPVRQNYSIKVAVLYSGNSKTYLDVYGHFSQPLLMNLKVFAIDVDKTKKVTFDKYDMVYPDISVKSSGKSEIVAERIVDYVARGGSVLLENGFYDWFPEDFLGAVVFEEVLQLPDTLELPEIRHDLVSIQKLVSDFYENFKRFRMQDEIKDKNFGYGMRVSTAVPIVKTGDISLYALNYYKKGYVLFCNSLLPNAMFINGFDMCAKTENQAYFNHTVSSANQMLGSEYATFISKQKYGYALKRVFGAYGRPAMAWQNHFELLSGIGQGAMKTWLDIAREYDQIPSYSLVRGSFEWGTRYESIGYHINRDIGVGMTFATDEDEAFYAAGRHAVAEDGWLALAKSDTNIGFFEDIGDISERAYPFVKDLNGDGIADIVCGSSDGYFYHYEGVSCDETWVLNKAKRIKSTNNSDLRVGDFSSPVLHDIDGDGFVDLVSGCGEGNIYWFRNDGNFCFEFKGLLVNVAQSVKLSAPDIGALDGDGIPDLVVGTKNGDVFFYKGRINGGQLAFETGNLLMTVQDDTLKGIVNSAPRIIDLDGNSVNDLVIGVYDGYIKKYINDGMVFTSAGYFEDKMPNYLGDKRLKNGNNNVPAFADLNGDGKLDLIVGRLEFGMAVAIDSPWFPYKNELQEALTYLKDNYVSIEPHNFTYGYKDTNAEQRELERHRSAFDKLGLMWDGNGTNQHTWKINKLNPLQTFLNQYNSGLNWNSGFEPANSGMDPSAGTENTWVIPFYLYDGEKNTGMMIFNTAPSFEDVYEYIGRWDVPVSYYRHVERDAIWNVENLRSKAKFLSEFRDKYEYNFMTEQQMAKCFVATLNTSVKVGKKPFIWMLYTLQNLIRTLQQFEITLKPDVGMDSRKLLDGDYRNVAGVKVEPGEKYLSAPLDTNADIYMRDGFDMYIGLNKPVKVFVSRKPKERTYIERVNMPVEIATKKGGMKIRFLDGGLQQIKLSVPNNDLSVQGQEWKTEQTEDGKYTLTRFGGPTKLEISYSK